jgi:hypothetical protein
MERQRYCRSMRLKRCIADETGSAQAVLSEKLVALRSLIGM